MGISLVKGQKVNLAKDGGGSLDNILVGLGWDAASSKGKGLLGSLFGGGQANIDCDASVMILNNDGKFVRREDLVYFGNLIHPSGAVRHMGDNLTGEGEGDDEQVLVQLSKLPADCGKIVFIVNIYDCVKRNQHFGMINNAFIRIVDGTSNKEFLRYNLTEDYAGKTSLIVGEIYKHNGEWKFAAVGEATTDPGIADIVRKFS